MPCFDFILLIVHLAALCYAGIEDPVKFFQNINHRFVLVHLLGHVLTNLVQGPAAGALILKFVFRPILTRQEVMFVFKLVQDLEILSSRHLISPFQKKQNQKGLLHPSGYQVINCTTHAPHEYAKHNETKCDLEYNFLDSAFPLKVAFCTF